MTFRRVLILFGALAFVINSHIAYAAPVDSSAFGIDPRDDGSHYASFLSDPGVDATTSELRINFGKFTSQPDYNMHITTDGHFRGYAWGALSGWIIMSCEDTTSGCSSTNGNFGVSVEDSGKLKGYAWGETTGWVNFGPFTNSAINRVTIDRNGNFMGYAWSENFGWIVFDCASASTCVATDYRAVDTAPSRPHTSSNPVEKQRIEEERLAALTPTQPTQPIYPTVPVQPVAPTKPIIIAPSGNTPSTTTGPDEVPESLAPTFPTGSVEIPSNVPITTGVSDISVPQTRAAALDFIRTSITLVKDFFAIVTQAIGEAMQDTFAKFWTIRVAKVGIVFAFFAALFIPLIAPVVAGADVLLYPMYIAHNIGSMLGLVPRPKPWGVLYNTTTSQPLPMTRLTLLDAQGAPVGRAMSEPDGSFAFRAPAGVYSVRVEGLGESLTLDSTAQPLFGPLYTPGTQVGVAEHVPSQQMTIGIKGAESPSPTPLQQFVLTHEVGLTNISLALFGAGILSSVLSVIFYPSATTLAIAGVYTVICVLRSVGLFGSYASMFLDKASGMPLAGKLIRAIDVNTKSEVARTLTSRFGRAYMNLPRGHYYTIVSDPATGALPGDSTATHAFVARGGLHRQHFEL